MGAQICAEDNGLTTLFSKKTYTGPFLRTVPKPNEPNYNTVPYPAEKFNTYTVRS